MIRLTSFELSKIWKKRSFLVSVVLLFSVNIFLLWYTNLPDDITPPLSAYKAVLEDLSGMTENEKSAYVNGLYSNGEYVKYTESLEQEHILIQELFEEQTKVAGYEKYLESVQNNLNILNTISIFNPKDDDTFSSRNIKKSATDYASLTTENICWFPSKGIVSATENAWTDLLMLLSVFLFVGSLITEEKEKRLFSITRATKYGMGTNIFTKLGALFIHSITVAGAGIICNFLFFSRTTGMGDLTARIQSLAPYMESGFSISIAAYIILTIVTKGFILFFFGTFLTSVAVFSNKSFMPYLFGIALWGISWIFYQVIPAQSVWNIVKYLNPVGLLRTQNLYGAYLNFNVFGHPVSQIVLSWFTIILCTIFGIITTVILFIKYGGLEMKQICLTVPLRFRPHDNLFWHESYKILVTNRAAVILLLFAVLISSQIISREYHPSVKEQYYQDFMMQLEGDLNEEKESVILSEQVRFEDAFTQISKIDTMIANGEVSENTGESMKQPWYGVTTFYPAFERIMVQYENIKANGGKFLYDTGYLYLFGILNNEFPIQLLLISLCSIFSFSNAIAMEYQKKSWYLLCATKMGRKQILRRKIILCLICVDLITILPWIVRWVVINQVYPMHGLGNMLQAIPNYENFGIEMPIFCFFTVIILSQLIAVSIITLLVLLISKWQKNQLHALFFSTLLLAIPLILKNMGLDFAGWFSVYPLYAWCGFI